VYPFKHAGMPKQLFLSCKAKVGPCGDGGFSGAALVRAGALPWFGMAQYAPRRNGLRCFGAGLARDIVLPAYGNIRQSLFFNLVTLITI